MVATTVGEDEETPPPLDTTISVHTSVKVCTVYVCALKYVYTGNSVVSCTQFWQFHCSHNLITV